MVSRPYKCSLCNSAFRNESGMKWHLAHRHEIPGAFDALGKDYETKTMNLLDENVLLQKKLEQAEGGVGTDQKSSNPGKRRKNN